MALLNYIALYKEPTLTDINGMDKIIETLVSITIQFNSTTVESTSLKHFQQVNIITFIKGGFITGLLC